MIWKNPKSIVKTAVLPKSAAAPEQVPYGLRALIAEVLREALEEQGYDPAGESLRIDTISAVSVDTPEFAEPSQLYTMFHVTFTYSARTRTDPVFITSHILTSALTDQVEGQPVHRAVRIGNPRAHTDRNVRAHRDARAGLRRV